MGSNPWGESRLGTRMQGLTCGLPQPCSYIWRRQMKKLSMVLIACGTAAGALAQIPVGVDLGIFMPTDSDVKDVYGKSWFRVGITPLSFQQPGNWRFTFDLGFLKRSRSIFIP